MIFNMWDSDGNDIISFQELALNLKSFKHLDITDAANAAMEAMKKYDTNRVWASHVDAFRTILKALSVLTFRLICGHTDIPLVLSFVFFTCNDVQRRVSLCCPDDLGRMRSLTVMSSNSS